MRTGENIARLRGRCGMTQDELAQRIGVSRSYVARLERGSSVVSLALAKQIADIFCVKIDELMA